MFSGLTYTVLMSSGPYDLMISYRRENEQFATGLVDRLQESGMRCFLDTKDHRDGHEFSPQWREALQSAPDPLLPEKGPTVLVLLTEAMLQPREPGKDVVVREISDANAERAAGRDIPIVPLVFSEAAFDEIGRRLGDQSNVIWNELHRGRAFTDLDVANPSSLTGAGFEDLIRYVLWLSRESVLRRLDAMREEAITWSLGLIASLYTEDALNPALTPAGSQAIVGPGGSGKTIQMARTVLAHRAEPKFCPLLLTAIDFENAGGGLREKLGLPGPSLADGLDLLQSMARTLKLRVVFITDSLERMDVATVVPVLRELETAGHLWLTSRPEAFGRASRDLSISPDAVSTPHLTDTALAARRLGISEREIEETRQFLCQALYFDIGFRLKSDGIALGQLHNPTDLIEAFFNFAIRVPIASNNADTIQDEKRFLLTRLSSLQFTSGRFEVPTAELKSACESIDYSKVVDGLKDLVLQNHISQTIRLRHDVIDSFNIASNHSDTFASLTTDAKVDHFLRPASAVVFEGFIQLAHDRGSWDFIRDLLALYLTMVDRKQDKDREPRWDVAGWNLGYAATAKAALLAPELMRLMSGEFIGATGKSTSDPPALVEATLSSVASLMKGLATESVADDGAYLAILRRMMGKTSLRARLIEAVSKLRMEDDSAFEYLAELSGDLDMLAKDIDVAIYLAPALCDLARKNNDRKVKRVELAQSSIGAIIGFVDERLNGRYEGTRSRGFDLKLRRRLVDALNSLGAKIVAQLPLSLEELDAGLSLHDDRMQYSDWDEFERYSSLLRRELHSIDKSALPRLCVLVGRGFHHFHIRCAHVAADALGRIDHSWARGILVGMVEAAEDEQTISLLLQAMKLQVERGHPRIADAARVALARREQEGRSARAVEIQEWLSESVGTNLVTSNGIEVEGMDIRRLGSVNPSSDSVPMPTWMTENELAEDVGEEREKKVRFGSQSGLLCFAEGTWKDPMRIYRAIRARMEFGLQRWQNPRPPKIDDAKEAARLARQQGVDFARSADKRLEVLGHLGEVVEATYARTLRTPNIAVVHVIITSADEHLLQAQRSFDSEFAPGAWSISFEEQMKQEDFASSDPVMSTIQRGVEEEFGFVAAENSLVLQDLRLSIECDSANLAIMAVVGTSLTAAEFDARCEASRADGEVHGQSWRSADAALSDINRSSAGYWYSANPSTNHPGNVMRLAMLDRWIRSNDMR